MAYHGVDPSGWVRSKDAPANATTVARLSRRMRLDGGTLIAIRTGSPAGGAGASARPNNALGIILMTSGMFMFGAADAQAKLLTETLHPIQIIWFRYLGLVAAAVLILSVRGLPALRTARPGLQLARGACAASSATLFVVALGFVPLADAVAVAFVAPFMVTVLAALLLREPVGIRRWIAVTIGFLGAMIVIRPGLGTVHPAAMLVLAAAGLFALRQIISRFLSATDRTETTIVYTALVGLAIMTVPLLFVWQTPATRTELLLLAGLGLCGAVGEVLVIKALEVAQAVVVAPMQYTLLLWGTLYGYFLFADLPHFWTWVGAAIIVATGLYTLHRERVVARKRSRAAAR
jgi:S-adenosylmethionine uptake transporter